MRVAIKRAEIRRIIRDTKTLPTLPGVITRLAAMAEKGTVSAEEMARVVMTDQVLSAKVIRLVNSAFYGFYGTVSTVSGALVQLGVNVVKGLAISSSIFEIMEKNTVGLWEHSMGVAVSANVMAKRLKLKDPEEIATAALLHDIGKVIIKIKLEEAYDQLVALIQEKDLMMIEAERELLETDHSEIGAWLAQTWHLPASLIEPIAWHHNVEKSIAHQAKTAVVHIADVITHASAFGFSGDDLVPKIQTAAWNKLGLTDQHLESIVDEVEDRLIDAKNLSIEIQAAAAPKISAAPAYVDGGSSAAKSG
jgi:putative nucleotidyltransferase with HDIG domain